MTTRDPIERYLSELRTRLRVRDAGLILAEAEDHLREDVAAGRAAGLSEQEAQYAAISSFGSVRAVIRAHQPRWRRAVARLSGPALAVPRLAGLFLATFSITSLAGLVSIGLQAHALPPTVAIVSHIVPGLAGLALLYATRPARRRSPGHLAPAQPARFAAAATLLFGVTTVALMALGVAGAVPLQGPLSVGCLVLAVGYAIRLNALRRREGEMG
jgi:hypothetical protein